MVADITSSSLRSIYKFDDTEGAIYFVLLNNWQSGYLLFLL